MNKIISIEPAIDPTNRPTFLLDWELTMKCNLDCDYCRVDIETGGHDNSTEHPPLDECLKTIDFMFAYADKYMSLKPKWQRMVVLNVYGGESIFHPNIVEILESVRERHAAAYADKWALTVTCTTNAVAGKNLWKSVAALIDEFTISFHSTALDKQRQQVKDNLLYNKSIGRSQKVVFVMHNNQAYWDISQENIEFCKTHDIKYVVKANDTKSEQWQYNKNQIQFFKNYYKGGESLENAFKTLNPEKAAIGSIGRSCCGGRKLCANQDLKNPMGFMPVTNFNGWNCSVNWYFLFIKQVNGKVYFNKDCKVNFDGTLNPIGNLRDSDAILRDQEALLSGDTVPALQCVKTYCICGYCAPKSENFEDFQSIMKKHVDNKVNFVYNSVIDK